MNIDFCEEYSVSEFPYNPESQGVFYRYICIEMVKNNTLIEWTFNVSCCIDAEGLSPDNELIETYEVIGKWLLTEKAFKSYNISKLRTMYFQSIF